MLLEPGDPVFGCGHELVGIRRVADPRGRIVEIDEYEVVASFVLTGEPKERLLLQSVR